MELFQVVNRNTLEVVKKFNNKMEAKKHRDSLLTPEDWEQRLKAPDAAPPFIISKGKDHRHVAH
jgi:hypothetical protein